ncbi:MAG: ectonucleotide pyrophosphatase/phosphodiesterase [Pyrinomonadaceae bacterium]|nr:ectonucleotide pyrophosphatase/phosphodiesterase [Pyrinomonadaceae bacterium]
MKIRMQKVSVFSALIFLTLAFSVFGQKAVKDLKPTVILISLDGFHPDYLTRYSAPNLNKLAKEGVRAKWLIPSFPTKTFPNHYTIATGLYPAHHGIVENNVYDFGAVFTLNKREEVENPRWWLGEPIWVTTQKQRQIAASYFFPGTETAIQGVKPELYRAYNGKVPNEMRVDKLLSWFDLPAAKRPTMLTLYFSDTDDAGHEFSPDAEETAYAVQNVDRLVGRLYAGLERRKIADKVNLIIVSDHGMATVNQSNIVNLENYFALSDTERILWTGEIVQIFPKPGNLEQIAAKLETVKNATCWKKADIPARFHYNDGARVAPIVCSANEGWILTNNERFEEAQKREGFDRPRGAHGYDNQLASMRALFIAHGAAFKKNTTAAPFENIHIYNLMCKILGLTPAKNDGNFDNVKGLLR